jgi:N-acetyl-gamma-glutamyl-phosphate reductase
MLVEVPLHLSALPETPSVERIHGALLEAYDGQRFVEVVDLDETEAMAGLEPEGLNGTNHLRLHVFGHRSGEQVRLVALLDNLGKGASGAAVQNLNIMLGLDEATGLS